MRKKMLKKFLIYTLCGSILFTSVFMSYGQAKEVKAAVAVDDALILCGILAGFGVYISYEWLTQDNRAKELSNAIENAYEETRLKIVSSGAPLHNDDDDDDNDIETDNIIPYDEFLSRLKLNQYIDMSQKVINAGMSILALKLVDILHDFFITQEEEELKGLWDVREFELKNISGVDFEETVRVGNGASDISTILEMNNPDIDFQEEIFNNPYYLGMELYTYNEYYPDGTGVEGSQIYIDRYIFSDDVNLEGDKIDDWAFIFKQYSGSASEFELHNTVYSDYKANMYSYYFERGSESIMPSWESIYELDREDYDSEMSVIHNTFERTYVNEVGNTVVLTYQTVLNPKIQIFDDGWNTMYISPEQDVIWVHPDIADTYANKGTLDVAPPYNPYDVPSVEAVEKLQQAMDEASQLEGQAQTDAKNQAIIDYNTATNTAPVVNPDTWPNYSANAGTVPDSGTDTDTNPDTGTDTGADVDYKVDLTALFPFCIPFDLVRCFKLFDAEPVTPRVQIPIHFGIVEEDYVFDIDLNEFNGVASVCRTCFLILYICGLALTTSRVIKW